MTKEQIESRMQEIAGRLVSSSPILRELRQKLQAQKRSGDTNGVKQTNQEIMRFLSDREQLKSEQALLSDNLRSTSASNSSSLTA